MTSVLSRAEQVAPSIAYFSMEIGLQSSVPTYSGGLGVLAGDTLKSSADLGLPMVAVTPSARSLRLRKEHGLTRESIFVSRKGPPFWVWFWTGLQQSKPAFESGPETIRPTTKR